MAKKKHERGERNLLDGFESVRGFLLAGAATVTVTNTRTHEHVTLRFRQKRAERGKLESPIFVSVLKKDGDNRSFGDYAYMGCVWQTDRQTKEPSEPRFVFAKGKALRNGIKSEDAAPKTAAWLLRVVRGETTIPDYYQVWHEGQCCYCGVELTQTESVQRGYGPVCARKRGLPWSKPTKTAGRRKRRSKKKAEPKPEPTTASAGPDGWLERQRKRGEERLAQKLREMVAPAPEPTSEEIALTVRCPECDAAPGEPCVNSIRLKLTSSHGKRIDLAKGVQWDPATFTTIPLFDDEEDEDDLEGSHSHEEVEDACPTCGRTGSKPCVSNTGRERRRWHRTRKEVA